MLRLFQILDGKKEEIFQINNLFNVYELGKYIVIYNSEKIVSNDVFLEDLPIDNSKIEISDSEIKLLESRYFEDYFGYAGLKIDNKVFHFNIKIEKLKLSEIEDIFTYLWDKQEKLFNIFFSKSTYELDFKKKGFELGKTSKLISFIETFITTFERLYLSFYNSPHTVLRKQIKKTNYTPSKVTPDTLDWILTNLDVIHFDSSFKGYHKAIKINNKYGIIDVMETLESENSFRTYENEIILGSFLIILKKLSQLKSEIKSNINIRTQNDGTYADFKDLKRIPFIKLFEDSVSLEKKVMLLYQKYKKLFNNIEPRTEKPVLTSVFRNKAHYQKAYTLIKNLHYYKFDLFGEFKLLNITKLSKLYEVYSLYIIVNALQNSVKLDSFEVKVESTRNDEIIEKLTITNEVFDITLFYEKRIYGNKVENQLTNLRRIYSKNGEYYNPDFIIELLNKSTKTSKYYILDAKYSKVKTVQNIHLSELVKKYILNIGIEGYPNSKINSLALIFPGETSLNIIDSEYFEPTVKLIASKPNYESELISYISSILNNNLSSNLVLKL